MVDDAELPPDLFELQAVTDFAAGVLTQNEACLTNKEGGEWGGKHAG